MENYNIALLGCGTVGSGTAKIISEFSAALSERSGKKINISKIVDLRPMAAAKKAGVDISLFVNPKEELSKEEASAAIKEVLADKSIDLVVETIGGDGDYIKNIHESVLKAGKNLVTANKSLLAKTGKSLFETAKENNKSIGFEAAVCGAIPIIKGLTECFTGDDILSVYGIMNGTSNFILSNMSSRGISFEEALKEAQRLGYAEADPSLDINGGDAANKLKILIQMIYGVDARSITIGVNGIDVIKPVDVAFAKQINSVIKLICYAKREGNKLYAAVRPMMLHKDIFLADINGATNAVRLINKYSGENILVGQGAGMEETGSAIVSDIVKIARGDKQRSSIAWQECEIKPFEEHAMNFNIILKSKDMPGVTGAAAKAIGDENVNIFTIGPNFHEGEFAYFSIVTETATLNQINRAVAKMRELKPGAFEKDVKVFPIIK
ncbi:Homoserine dehydrogenase [Elusimicrobium minutum Pei191]|uniref:Homoserine dehydrogenase n=1 Tax=Elusimicrobium minutum (strain Pei191) TaxID=445932 RepID=B2KD19_ELUMP|nr:homoserine dehydrogenase [Elusimicrobium minutum]ACC98415.1 Homoserine dehydrogenase [Elusimicrobium minutum Pei191]